MKRSLPGWCRTPRVGQLGLLALTLMLTSTIAFGQETTAGLQGTIRDSSGGAIAKAGVTVTSQALIGMKKLDTDSSGYYRFANLPPGPYTVTVSATGFRTSK